MTFEEQIISKDKYPRIFPRPMEAIVFIIVILQIFFRNKGLLRIGKYYSRIFSNFSCGIFCQTNRMQVKIFDGL